MGKKRHRRKRRFPVGLLLLVIICIILFRFVFVVRNVDIQGNYGTLTHEAVVRAAGIGFGKSIFTVDKDRIRERIDGNGMLKCMDVRLKYPDTVLISVQARSREAMVMHMGKMLVLDETGCVVEALDAVPAIDLVYVSGMRVQGYTMGAPVRSDAGQTEGCISVIQALDANGADMFVSELNVDNISDMRIITRTGITVELGDASNMNAKIAWMKSTVADLERRGQSGGRLDVRSGTKADYLVAVY